MKSKKIQVINSRDEDNFTKRVNVLLDQGGIISATSCGFVPSEKYAFCDVYQAIVIMPKQE